MSTLAELETRVTALESIQQGEQASPNYLTVNAAGDITGINTLGLQIPAASSALAPSGQANRIEWTRTSDGALVFELVGVTANVSGTEEDYAIVRAYPIGDTGNWYAEAELQALDTTPAVKALIGVSTQNGQQPAAFANAQPLGGGSTIQATIVDGAGKSSFLQLLSAQQLQLAFGASSVSWPGGSPFSGSVTITYGIGRLAQAVYISPSATSGATLTGMSYFNLTGTTFQVQARTLDGTSPGAGVTAGFSWAAIG